MGEPLHSLCTHGELHMLQVIFFNFYSFQGYCTYYHECALWKIMLIMTVV